MSERLVTRAPEVDQDTVAEIEAALSGVDVNVITHGLGSAVRRRTNPLLESVDSTVRVQQEQPTSPIGDTNLESVTAFNASL